MATPLLDDLFYVGVSDPDLRVFDIVMFTPYGTTYNSYLLLGRDKTVLFESVKERFCEEHFRKIHEVLSSHSRTLDILVLNHTEPDHSGSVSKLVEIYPELQIVGTSTALSYLEQIFGDGGDLGLDFCPVDSLPDSKLDLGGYTIEFIISPFLHWPDTMFSYIPELECLFPCDFFGSHYWNSNGEIIDRLVVDSDSTRADYDDALKYYYDCIFGPFRKYSSEGLSKIPNIDTLQLVGTSHGPVLTKDGLLPHVVETYHAWSDGFEHEDDAAVRQLKGIQDKVLILYVSAYGYTREMAEAISRGIENESGLPTVLIDVTYEEDESRIALEMSTSRGILFGTPTILGDALPNIAMLTWKYLNPIISKGLFAGTFGSYGWSGEGTRNFDHRLRKQLRLNCPLAPLRVNFRPGEESLGLCEDFGANFVRAMIDGPEAEIDERFAYEEKAVEEIDPFGDVAELPTDGKIRTWRCVVCGKLEEGVLPPEQCDACGVTGFGSWESLEGTAEQPQLRNWECTVCSYVQTDAVPPAFCDLCGAAGPDIWIDLGPVETTEALADFDGKLVIIGSGGAGVSAATAAREIAPEAEIWMIGEEEGLPYTRPNISKTTMVSVICDREFYVENDINMLSSHRAIGVDFESKEVISETLPAMEKKSIPYDRLIISTGSVARNPFGEFENLFTIHHEKDTSRLLSMARDGWEHVTVVGGGILGLEIADLMHREIPGLSFAVVDLADALLEPYLGPNSIASRVFAEGLPEAVSLELGTSVQSFEAPNGIVESVALANGEVVSTDGVVVAISTLPALSFLETSGPLEMNYLGIPVDTFMETNVDGVYACGDVALLGDFPVNTWENALCQGRVAGRSAVGVEEDVVPCSWAYHVDAFGLTMFSEGNVPSAFESAVLTDEESYYLKISSGDGLQTVDGLTYVGAGATQLSLLRKASGMEFKTVLKHILRLIPK